MLQGMISTSLLIPFNTMISRLTSDEQQRVQLTQADGIGQMLSQWMVVSLTFTFVGWLGGGDTRKGFLYVGIIYGIIYGIGHLIVYFATKGYEPVEHSAEPAESVKERTGSTLKDIISSMGAFYRNKVLMFCGAVAFLYTLGMAVEEGAMAWYFQYVKTDAEALYGIFGTMSMPVAIVIYLFLDKIVKKLGNAVLLSLVPASHWRVTHWALLPTMRPRLLSYWCLLLVMASPSRFVPQVQLLVS